MIRNGYHNFIQKKRNIKSSDDILITLENIVKFINTVHEKINSENNTNRCIY